MTHRTETPQNSREISFVSNELITQLRPIHTDKTSFI